MKDGMLWAGWQELRGHDCWFIHKLNPGDQMLLTPTPDAWNDILPIIPTLDSFKDTSLRE